MPEDEKAVMEAPSEVCACPGGDACKHNGKPARISLREGFILCALGQEKLCPECVLVFGDSFKCHGSHKE